MNPYPTRGNSLSQIRPGLWAPEKSAHSLVAAEIPLLASIIRRNKYLILLAFSFCLLASVLVAELQRPLFRAQALVEVQGLNGNFLKLSDYEPNTSQGGSPGSYISTQIRRLQSESLAIKVVDRTHLNQHPSFFRESDTLQSLRRTFHIPRKAEEHSVSDTARQLLGAVHAHVEGESDLIAIEVDAPDAYVAATLSNTFAQQYIADQQEERSNTALQTSNWLTSQLEDFRNRLQASEHQLQDYANASGLLFIGENSTATDEQLRQVQQELSKAQAGRAQQEAEFGLIASAPAETLPKVLDDGPMREYKLRLTDLRRHLVDLRTTLTPEHYKVERAQAEIGVLEAAVERERANILERIRNEYAASVQQEELLQREYQRRAKAVTSDLAKEVRYNVLKREVDTNRELYGSMMQKGKEASVLSALRTSSLRLVDPARAPLAPYRPKVLKTSSIGALCGILSSILLVLVRERLDRTLKTRGDILKVLTVQELGVIPALESRTLSGLMGRVTAKLGSGNRVGLKLNVSSSGAVIQAGAGDPRSSLFLEAFNCAAISLSVSNWKGCEVFLITSPHPRAGKSTVVANLGMALARWNRRGILVDGDLRRPSLHSLFDIPRSPGLTELLNGDLPIAAMLNEITRNSPIPGLKLLTVGAASDWRLLLSNRMAEVIEQLRKDYDFVLIDSPPMLQLSDARILARLADSVLLICRAGQTRADQAVEAAGLLWSDGSRLTGTILNEWNVKAEDPSYLRTYRSHYSES
jgi:succinoglycan biosynthesis transport protein ExoP